jgi:hypothetical protein
MRLLLVLSKSVFSVIESIFLIGYGKLLIKKPLKKQAKYLINI